MPEEKIGDQVVVETANHPPRTDSPEYVQTRKWLMSVIQGGCYICGGPVDLKHPEAPANATGLQDHHGGGINIGDVLVGFTLFSLEWSMGWGADPARITAFVKQLLDANLMTTTEFAAAGLTLPFVSTDNVMKWVDSKFNANVKLCAPHHVGHQTQHSPDANGHEAVGIHNAPWPILVAQAAWDWAKGDMWGGTTGTVAVAPHPTKAGHAVVTYVHESHPEKLTVGQELPPTHPSARAVHGKP